MCDKGSKDQEKIEESSISTEETASRCSPSISNTKNRNLEVIEKHLTKNKGKKSKTPIKLPRQLDISTKSETQVVGDDITRKNEQNIICECQPNVTGAAIPSMSSVNSLASNSVKESDLDHICRQSTIIKEPENVEQLVKESSVIPSTSKAIPDNKVSKKPSMIPKLTRPNSSNRPVRDRGQTDLLKKSVKEHHLFPKKSEKEKTHRSKIEAKNVTVHLDDRPTSKISSRMLNLQERLKATTSMLRQRFEEDKNKTDSSCQICSEGRLAKQESIGSQTSEESTRPTNVEELFKVITLLKDTATTLSNTSIPKKQETYIQKLLLKISEIQKIADQLSKFQSADENEEKKKDASKAAKTLDKKIYIKFVPKKEKDNDSKAKVCPNSLKDNTAGIQSLGSKLTTESLNSDINISEKSQQEPSVEDSDSMDGIFIPSCEPPIIIDEEEEPNGLDITITFPEISNLLSNQDDSHLSVRLSDISEEALKKLKRCPKDFTLRMDFIQGKILFQTGKAPINNFSIGPDLKFVENPVDEKKSDIISIKPSTECSFASQLIPVETITKEITSYKSLRSTDSELFSVVNLPFIYRNPSLNTVTKSCITFKNDGIISMALLARHFGRSMPQIPSLTNIFEEKMMENLNKATALQIQERRRKNRANQKRGIITPNSV